MTRKFTLLNIAAACLIIFMFVVTILNYKKSNNGWDTFTFFMAAGFSSLLFILDYFIQTKIKTTLKLFIVELLALIILSGLGILITNS
jgi:hypothetical protein